MCPASRRPALVLLLPLPLALAVLGLAACSRSGGTVEDAGAVDASGMVSPSPSPSPSEPEVPVSDGLVRAAAPAAHVHASRARLTRLEDDPALAANQAVVRAHFDGGLPASIAVQRVTLTQKGASAVTVLDPTRPPAEAHPLVLVVDEPTHHARFTKERPAAGIVPPIGPVAIASGPRGRVAFAVCDPPTKRVALRLWDDDGSAFADFDAMDAEDCTTLSALYWPRHGWILVATRPGETRAQLVSEDGALRWGRGTIVGARSRMGAAAALGADGDAWELVQPGPGSGRGPNEIEDVYAFRYDASATELHPPVRLAALPVRASSLEPVPIDRVRSGVFRVKVGARAFELGPSGVLGP